jgi:hypothetical protein
MKTNQKGQALIELIVFLPLMLMFYTMIAGFANAINGSINQQKITRGYFYYRAQANSSLPKPAVTDSGGGYSHDNWKRFGMFIIGWKDYLENSKPMAPCYKITVPLGTSTTDPPCNEKYTATQTQYIRVQTVYGICGATYENVGSEVFSVPDAEGMDFATLIGAGSCVIQ